MTRSSVDSTVPRRPRRAIFFAFTTSPTFMLRGDVGDFVSTYSDASRPPAGDFSSDSSPLSRVDKPSTPSANDIAGEPMDRAACGGVYSSKSATNRAGMALCARRIAPGDTVVGLGASGVGPADVVSAGAMLGLAVADGDGGAGTTTAVRGDAGTRTVRTTKASLCGDSGATAGAFDGPHPIWRRDGCATGEGST